jgi:hypothetical protein
MTAAWTASHARAAVTPLVLELFTSQGCSSCPPADALLGELSHRPGVIALAWHVDYWNSLGWRDPYASAAWTARQRSYARRLHEEVYTPALIVNGTAMVIGSDKAAVRSAMQQAPMLPVEVALHRTAGTAVATVGALPEGATILRVLYEQEGATRIGAGENAGRRLREYRIVRDMVALPPSTGSLALNDIAPGLGVALLVENGAGSLIGAADLPPA